MKLRTFFTLFFVLLVAMVGMNLIVQYYLDKTEDSQRFAKDELHALEQLSEDIVIASQWQSRVSRAYVETADVLRKILFNRISDVLEGKIPRPSNYGVSYWDLVIAGYIDLPGLSSADAVSLEDRFTNHNISPEELIKVIEIHNVYKKLTSIERVAMNAVDGKFDDGTGAFRKSAKPDPELAHKLLYSQEYNVLNGDLSLRVTKLMAQVDDRLSGAIKSYKEWADRLVMVRSALNLTLFGLIIMFLLFLRLRFSERSALLMKAVRKVSLGDLATRAPEAGGDEISEFARAFNKMAANLRSTLDELKEKIQLSEETLTQLDSERRKSEKLLHDVLPAPIAQRLSAGEQNIAELHPEVSVFFSDLVGFTQLSAKIGPTETVRLLNAIFGELDELVEKHNVEKIKTIGDAYMVVGGVPHCDPLHCQNVAEFAMDARSFMETFSEGLSFPLQMRIGIHTGTVVAGVVGKKKFSYDLWGDVVNVASRYESTSQPNKIHVSEAVKVRLEEDYLFADGGIVELKGKGSVKSYYLDGRKA